MNGSVGKPDSVRQLRKLLQGIYSRIGDGYANARRSICRRVGGEGRHLPPLVHPAALLHCELHRASHRLRADQDPWGLGGCCCCRCLSCGSAQGLAKARPEPLHTPRVLREPLVREVHEGLEVRLLGEQPAVQCQRHFQAQRQGPHLHHHAPAPEADAALPETGLPRSLQDTLGRVCVRALCMEHKGLKQEAGQRAPEPLSSCAAAPLQVLSDPCPGGCCVPQGFVADQQPLPALGRRRVGGAQEHGDAPAARGGRHHGGLRIEPRQQLCDGRVQGALRAAVQ
mmetsp:Transcript_35236/g.112053  ORF Transcript_35236/g.112053 Transcript_35236/m.112053 type:complete len:283 (-) Transcript_35236:221-1069(-)